MDPQEMSDRFISGASSLLDPSTMLGNLQEGILGNFRNGRSELGMIEGGVTKEEIDALFKEQNTRALALVGDSDIQKEANKLLKLMHTIAQGKYDEAIKLAGEIRGPAKDAVIAEIQSLKDAAAPVDEPGPVTDPTKPDNPFPGLPDIDPIDPFRELPDILADGLIDMADVLRSRTAGFPDLAASLMDVLAGTIDMKDILLARSYHLDDLADQMARVLAGLPIVIELPEGLGSSSTDYDPEDTYSRAAASLSGPGYANMPFDGGGSAGVTIPVDLSNGVWGSNPRANAAMVEKAVDRAFSKQRDGLISNGLRG
jgi:hypothetical protein